MSSTSFLAFAMLVVLITLSWTQPGKAKGEFNPSVFYEGEGEKHEHDCQKPCPRTAISGYNRRICASNGKNYWNECTFEIAKCEAKLIDVTLIVKNNGPCNYKRPGETGSEHEESNYDHAGNEGLFIHINNPSSNYDYEYINNPSSGETESKDEGSNYDKNSGININNPTSE